MVQILAQFRRCSAVMEQDRRKLCSMAGAWPRGMEGVQGEEGGVDGSDKIMGQMTKIKWKGTSSPLPAAGFPTAGAFFGTVFSRVGIPL